MVMMIRNATTPPRVTLPHHACTACLQCTGTRYPGLTDNNTNEAHSTHNGIEPPKMPQEASKISNAEANADATAEAIAEGGKQPEAESADESGDDATEATEGATEKKKSRKRKIKDALTGKGKEAATSAPGEGDLSKEQKKMLLESNPALKNELQSKATSKADLEQMIKNLSMNEMLTGLAPPKNTKDMATHAFWKTQPVPSFDEMANKDKIKDGPIKEIDIEKVDKNPSPMYPGFEWVTMDLEDEKQLDEVYELLTNHYVEDKDATFRFKYSPSFLNWYATIPPDLRRPLIHTGH